MLGARPDPRIASSRRLAASSTGGSTTARTFVFAILILAAGCASTRPAAESGAWQELPDVCSWSRSIEETDGNRALVARMLLPRPSCPRDALALGIEGTVRARVAVGGSGWPARRADEGCRCFPFASKQDRRVRWHPTPCVEASPDSPAPLVHDTVLHSGSLRYLPLGTDERPPLFHDTVDVDDRIEERPKAGDPGAPELH